MDTFYLGVHHPNWLWDDQLAGVPMFPSDASLRERSTRNAFRPARAPYAVDSSGFSMLQKHGRWTITPERYVHQLRRYRDELGPFEWAAQQDWMCEDPIRLGGVWNGQQFAGTGLTVAQHQDLSDRNYHELRDLDSSLPIIYVVQGQRPDDYLRHRDLAASRGVDLTTHSLVGVGSVCRRQHTGEAGVILSRLHREGITRLHGFGFKIDGLLAHGHLLTSADSMAWSIDGRRWKGRGTACGTVHTSHRGRPPAASCANCRAYALRWRANLLPRLRNRPIQPSLFEGDAA